MISSGQSRRVLMIASGNLNRGVAEPTTFVRSQAASLTRAGWDVRISVVDDRTSIAGIRRNIGRIRREISMFNPSVVHAQYGSVTAGVARVITSGVPLIVSFCGDDLLGTPLPGLTWRVRERCARTIGIWAAGAASAIVVKSPNLLEQLPANLKTRATILPNGVDLDWFVAMPRDDCRAALGWDRRARVVLFNASTNEDRHRKNPALARAAVELLAHTDQDVRLATLSNTTSAEVRLMLNAADCLLVTSLQEGSPNIVKEAMACGLPVVSVPCGDVGERLSATRPGGVYAYSAHALADGLREVLRSGARSNGREQLVVQGLASTSIAARLIDIYTSVRAEPGRPAEGAREAACVE